MKYSYLSLFVFTLVAVAVLGFAGPGNMYFQDDAAAQMMANCPRHVEGTAIQVNETETGVALTFTTTTGDVEELRSRVQMMADMHRGGQGMMQMHSAGKGGGMMQHMSSMHSMHGKNNVPAEKSEQSQQKGCMGTMHSQKDSTEQQKGAHSGGHKMMNGGQQKGGMGMMHGRMGSMMSDQKDSHMMMLPAAAIAYEAVPDGARLTFTPKDQAEKAALLDRLNNYAEMMNGGTCMQLMMGGMMHQNEAEQSDPGMEKSMDHSGHHE